MKISINQLNSYLKNIPKNIIGFLIYGQDQGLASLLIKNIKDNYLKNNNNSLNIIEIDSSTLRKNPEILVQEAFSTNLLGGEEKIIHIKNSTSFITPIINEYLRNPDIHTLLILEAEELPSNSSLRKLLENDTNFIVTACYHDNQTSLSSTISTILKNNGFIINKEALIWLINNLGNDRLITEQELNKLFLYKNNNKNIELEDVIKVIGNNTDLNLQKIIFESFNGNISIACNYLEKIKNDIQPIIIIRSLNNHLRKLLYAAILVYEGISISEAVSKIKPPVIFMYVESFKKQLIFWDLKKINRYIEKLTNLELLVKNNPNIAITLISHIFTEMAIEINKISLKI